MAALSRCPERARAAADAMEAGRRHYGFPWYIEHVVFPLASLLPRALYDYILSTAAAPLTAPAVAPSPQPDAAAGSGSRSPTGSRRRRSSRGSRLS